VSTYSDYPDEVLALPLVGDAFVIDQEQLALLEPDMLLAWQSGTPQHVVGELSNRGYRVEVIQTRSLADIASALETIGELTGNTALATQAAADFRRGLQALAERYSAAEPIRVFYQVDKRPLYTIGGDHFVSELIEHCGGQNVFSDLVRLASRQESRNLARKFRRQSRCTQRMGSLAGLGRESLWQSICDAGERDWPADSKVAACRRRLVQCVAAGTGKPG
jgi:ABC-type hemin transport system substrate-binding protein